MGTPADDGGLVLEGLLRQVLEPSTAQHATEALKDWMARTKQSALLLLQQMAQSPAPEIRQLAAVLLRRRLCRAWGTLTLEAKAEVKKMLLNRLVEDPIPRVRLAVAHLVSSLGKLTLEEWKGELFPFLKQCASSNQESHREAAIAVFTSIIDSLGDTLKPHFKEFVEIFLAGLTDPVSSSVRIAAMKGVGQLAGCAEDEIEFNSLRHLIPSMVAVTKEAVEAGKEDVVVYALEIFDDLIDSAQALQRSDYPDLIRFMLLIGKCETLPCGVREQAFNFLHTISKRRPKIITQNNLVPEILQAVIPMGVSKDPEDAADGDGDGTLTPHSIAVQCIDSLSLNLPSRFVYEPVLAALQPYTQSTDEYHKRGALVMLGIMSEGCEDVMQHQLKSPLLPFVLESLRDTRPIVQSAAAVCLGQMAEYLQPEITKYHREVIGALLAVLTTHREGKETVTEKLCYAVELFCDNMEEFEIISHIDALMPALFHALRSSSTNATRESCLGAIGAVAQAAKEKFEPYLKDVYAIVAEAMAQTDDSNVTLRARATTTAGYIVQAMPRESFTPYREKFVGMVVDGWENIDNHDLREARYRFLACLAYTLNDEMSPLLPTVVPFAAASLLSGDGVVMNYEDSDDDEDVLDGVDEEEDEEDDRRIKGYTVRTGFLDEQMAAMDFLSSLFRNLSGGYMAGWLKKSLEVVNELHKYFRTSIRQQVPTLMRDMMINVHHTFLPDWAPRSDASPTSVSTVASAGEASAGSGSNRPENAALSSTADNRGWTAGLPAGPQSQLHSHTLQLWLEKLWPVFYDMITLDDDKEVVGDVCRCVGEILEICGPHLLQSETVDGHEVHSTLLNVAVQIFSGEHECQKGGDDEGEIDENEESRTIEEYLFEGTSGLISGLAQTMGPQFHTPFLRLHKKMLVLATHKMSSTYRCIGLGCYGDLIKTMGASAVPFIEPIVPAALAGIEQNDDISLKRNASFCLGVLAEAAAGQPAVQSQLPEFVRRLIPVAEQPTQELREAESCVRDNALAALGRIIRVASPGVLQAEIVVPLFIKTLPLKADFDESEGVLQTLMYLFSGGCDQSILAGVQMEFLRDMVAELVNAKDSLTTSTKQKAKSTLSAALKGLGALHTDVQRVATLDPRYAELMQKLMA